jgi:hypothetical protein
MRDEPMQDLEEHVQDQPVMNLWKILRNMCKISLQLQFNLPKGTSQTQLDSKQANAALGRLPQFNMHLHNRQKSD